MLAVDVYYKEDGTYRAVGIVFDDWRQDTTDKIIVVEGETPGEYVPGQFYKRELPCILKVLEKCPTEKTVIIDGFIDLKRDGSISPGLERHLLDERPDLTVVGVAKSKFAENQDISEEVYRGESRNPLWVQGIAGTVIKDMHGPYRIPTILKILDQETKKG